MGLMVVWEGTEAAHTKSCRTAREARRERDRLAALANHGIDTFPRLAIDWDQHDINRFRVVPAPATRADPAPRHGQRQARALDPHVLDPGDRHLPRA